MSKYKNTVLCILFIMLLTSTVYGKEKIDNGLVKVFISEVEFDTDNPTSIGWVIELVYSQLKKLKTPFYVLKEKENFDLILVPKITEYKKIRRGYADFYRNKNYRWAGKIDFEEIFTVKIMIIDSYGNIVYTIQKQFSGKGYNQSLGKESQKSAEYEVEFNFLNTSYTDITKEFYQRIYQTLTNNAKFENYKFYLQSLNTLKKTNLIDDSANNYILWSSYSCEQKNINLNNPFIKIRDNIQSQIDEYLTAINQIDISSQIPNIIDKPILPDLPKLIKGQFETKDMFDERVRKAMEDRQFQIIELQEKYRKDVVDRNKIIENLTIDYENEQKRKKENFPIKINEFTQKAFFSIMGIPQLINPEYDAETETMYVDLKASNAVYQKRISLNIPLSVAEKFYNDIQSNVTRPLILYSIENKSINLNQIRVYSGKEYYLATLTDEDFKPETIEVVLEDKKIEFDSQKQMNLELQNPNLIDTYKVSAIQYGEPSDAKGLTYNDDITPLVRELESKIKDSSKWLFIIAVENYDETDPVTFSKNSAELFKETAQKIFGIKERNTYALIENDATSGKIKDRLQRLIDNVKYGDIIYFYYSGHGVPVPKTEESFILPKDKIVDYISKESEFNLSNIYKKLSDSKAETVFAFIDACFSGKTDNIPLFKGVAPGLIKTKKINFNKKKMVVLTAGKDNQFSNSFDEKGHRMFSYYLIKSLSTRSDIDIDWLYKDISVKVHDASFEKGDIYIQEPQIYGNKKLNLFNKE